MTKIRTLEHRYVETIPGTIQDGILYISREYSTAVHNCCCGCGQEVVTPLGPTDWRVNIKDGEVCVYPSIGNWSFTCRSHYWIDRGRVQWAEQWAESQVRSGRMRDQMAKQKHFGEGPHARSKWTEFWSWLWQRITRR